MDKKVSIIIPVYNAEKTIAKCIESILSNSFSDYEIILINDGSSDGSLKILEAYASKYPDKIKTYSQENQGVAITRNKGLEYAVSEYVIFIDNDDYVDKDYISRFVEEIEKKNLDIVIGGYRRTDREKTLYEMRLKPFEWSKYMIMAPWAKIYRREFLTTNGLEFLDNNIGEDVYFNLQTINLTKKISIIDYCGYNWFYNKESVSNTSQKTIESGLNVGRLLDESYKKIKEIDVTKKEEVEFYFIRYIVWYLLFVGKNSDSRKMQVECVNVFGWLKEKFPNFQKNGNISLLRPKGETLMNRIIVWVFMNVYVLRMTGIFFGIYSKKKNI